MSRDKQIEEMKKDLIEIFDEEYEKRRIITADFTAIKMTAKGYRKQSEWISVEERLPEEGGTYLVVLKEKHECEKEWNYHVDVASFTFEWDCIFHDWDEGQGIEITHWMPLPEPPKKGGGE